MWQLAIVAVFQGAKWANISNIRLTYSDLAGSEGGKSIPIANLTCFNIDGVDQTGEAFTMQPHINTTLGSILPLWLGVDLGMDLSGSYTGSVVVTADVDGKADVWTATQRYSVTVAGAPLLDRGDSNASLISRLRWLNSRFGIDLPAADNFKLPKPFTAVQQEGRSINLFNKQIQIGNNGFPSTISVASPPYATRTVLQAPMTVTIPGLADTTDGDPSLEFTSVTPAQAHWRSTATLGDDKVALLVNGSTHFDGYSEFVVTVKPGTAAGPVAIPDIRVSIPMSQTACRWMMKGGGTGEAIGNASNFSYNWTAGKPNNLFWIGSVQAGLRLRLRGPEFAWMQPRGPYHYLDLPPVNGSLPKFWHNQGQGGVSFSTDSSDGTCTLEAFTGPLTLSSAEPVALNFDVIITPNKPADSATHFQKQRYYQMESKLVPSDTLLDEGVNVANVHQGTPYNPWIIYPLDPVANAAAKEFAQRVHKGGSKVKTYYSSGSLSFITPELWAFFSMYGELMSHPAYVDPIPPPTPPPMLTVEQERQAVEAPPAFISHHWFLEHAGTALFSSDWTTPLAVPSHSPVCEGW